MDEVGPTLHITTNSKHTEHESAALVGDQMLFMGGNYSYVEASASLPQPYLYSLNLNRSLPVNGLISSGNLWSYKVPSDVPWKDEGGAFFSDNTTVYLYAGLGDEDMSETNQIWSFNVSRSEWRHIVVNGGNFQKHNRLGGIKSRFR